MIYTGYFAMVKRYTEAGLTPVSIARFNRYFSGIKYPALAPPAEMIKMDEGEYIPRYKEQVLGTLNPSEVADELQKLGGQVILLCYEKPADFCHRQLVSEWLRNAGIESEEFPCVPKKRTDSKKALSF